MRCLLFRLIGLDETLQPAFMRVRRFAMTLSYLEYLADADKLAREEDEAGTLHYSPAE